MMSDKSIGFSATRRIPFTERAYSWDPGTGANEHLDQVWPRSTTRVVQQTRTTSSSTPGWRNRIKHGENATTKLIGTKTKVTTSPGYAWIKLRRDWPSPSPDTFNGSEFEGNFCTPVTFAGSIPADLTTKVNNLALTGFVNAALSKQHQMQSLVSMGELAETIRTLRNPYVGITKWVDRYRRRAWTKRKLIPKGPKSFWYRREVQDAWLSTQFGLLPIISDAEDCLKAISRLQGYRPWAYVRFPAGSKQDDGRSSRSVTSNVNGLTIDYIEFRDIEVTVEYRGVVDLKTDERGFQLASQNFGLDWQNVVPAAWELFPWSFLADYFSNIGDVISAFAFNRSRMRWVAKTTRTNRSTRIGSEKFRPFSHATIKRIEEQMTPGTYIHEVQTVNRDTYLGSLVPDFQVEIPGLWSDSIKWANMAALFRSRRLGI